MKKYAEFAALILIGVAIIAFPGFDWRHIVLFVAQGILLVSIWT